MNDNDNVVLKSVLLFVGVFLVAIAVSGLSNVPKIGVFKYLLLLIMSFVVFLAYTWMGDVK